MVHLLNLLHRSPTFALDPSKALYKVPSTVLFLPNHLFHWPNKVEVTLSGTFLTNNQNEKLT
jgi:hypothetical protein